MLKERINEHPMKNTAQRLLSNSEEEEEIDFDQLLQSMEKLTRKGHSGKLFKALTERGSEKPRFLTVNDFKDASLAIDVINAPASYAITICVPCDMYERMKADPTLANLHIIQKAVYDKQDPVVHLYGNSQNNVDVTFHFFCDNYMMCLIVLV